MSLRDLNRLSDPSDWDRKWNDIFDRYQKDLRHAHYIHALLGRNDKSILELAAGSFRDMAALRRMGLDASGMDFSNQSVMRAKASFPEYADHIYEMSAFEMTFDDKQFDVSYHNGFWVLFSDDQLESLAKEQSRVTSGRMIATVHNAHNQSFVDYFEKMKQTDPLYDIRFFRVDEITDLMRTVCKHVRVIPVGKGKRRHEDALIRMGITNPTLIRNYFRFSGQRLLTESERLLCIGVPE